MKLFGYFLTFCGFISMATGIICRLNTDILKFMPLKDLTPSSFAHFGDSLFLAAIAAFVCSMVKEK